MEISKGPSPWGGAKKKAKRSAALGGVNQKSHQQQIEGQAGLEWVPVKELGEGKKCTGSEPPSKGYGQKLWSWSESEGIKTGRGRM